MGVIERPVQPRAASKVFLNCTVKPINVETIEQQSNLGKCELDVVAGVLQRRLLNGLGQYTGPAKICLSWC